MKNIVIINAHPDKESLNYALSESYISGLDSSQWKVSTINLIDLVFLPGIAFEFVKGNHCPKNFLLENLHT